MVEQWVWLLPVLPLLAAVWVGVGLLLGWNRGEAGERETALVSSLATGLALAGMLWVDITALLAGAAPGSLRFFPWMETVGYRVMVSVTLDTLGMAMATLAALLAFLTTRFSIHYLHREAGFQRFFALLNLFVAGLLQLLLAGNAVLAFVGWELMGLTSYLLIGYALDRETATRNATRVFVTNRVGDAGFTVGILLSYTWLGGAEWSDLVGGSGLLNSFQLGVLSGGFLLAALVKSAQFPFAAWIGRALEGPTPSSAIFYGSLMIHAGVYLLLRLEHLIAQSPFLLVLLVLLGGCTVLYGVLVGLVQTDVKSGLISATQTQVGIMVLTCGLGRFDLATWHLALHAGWRAYQFLSAPSYMHLLDGPTPPAWGGVQRREGLFAAALARFWLDPWTDLLLTRPTHSLARDVQSLDDRLVNRLLGNGSMERLLFGDAGLLRAEGGGQPSGVGLPGALLAWVATRLQQMEDLILGMGGAGMTRTVAHLGGYLQRIDLLFSEPRYLVLMILFTFFVIL
ncbi:MAG: hypothetical protein H7836_00795 [Magnetococcus sp. YQC-3]